MSEDKKYTIIVKRKRHEVTYKVYKAYYQEYERERYMKNLASDFERSLEGFAEDGVSVEYQYALSRPSLEDVFFHGLALDKLNAALAHLDAEDQMLIDRLYFDGKSERELSAETGIPQKTINDRKHRILQKLKIFIEK